MRRVTRLQQGHRRDYGYHLIPLATGDRQSARGRVLACMRAQAKDDRTVAADGADARSCCVGDARGAGRCHRLRPADGGSGSSMPVNDLVGGGGQIDQTYREIYHPGRGTKFLAASPAAARLDAPRLLRIDRGAAVAERTAPSAGR
jgi:hypothetical protein